MKRKSLDVVESNRDASQRAHITLKAVTTVGTDEGTFTAIISTESVDRELDIVDATAMAKALGAWGAVGKLIPLAWQHSPKAEDQIGHIKPETVEVKAGKVIGDGWIDQSTDRGKHAWRLVKSGTLGFSFGYMIVKATKREGGGYHITELDVYEVSATPTPMNHDTRVLGWKSTEELREEAKRVEREVEAERIPAIPPAPPADPGPTVADLMKELGEMKEQLATAQKALEKPPRTVEEQRREATKVLRAAEEEQIPDVPEQPKAPEMSEILKQELQEVKGQIAEMRKTLEDLGKKAEATDKETKSRSVDPLRQQADAVALEQASGGESLRKPPHKATPKPAELIPIGTLKQRMRDEMLARLSEGIPE